MKCSPQCKIWPRKAPTFLPWDSICNQRASICPSCDSCIRMNLPSTKHLASRWVFHTWNPDRWCALRTTRLSRKLPHTFSAHDSSAATADRIVEFPQFHSLKEKEPFDESRMESYQP